MVEVNNSTREVEKNPNLIKLVVLTANLWGICGTWKHVKDTIGMQSAKSKPWEADFFKNDRNKNGDLNI